MTSIRRATARLSEPMFSSIVVALLLVATGAAAIVLGWRGSATTLDVAEQTTYVVSGGIAAMAVLATGLTVLIVQRSRQRAAFERDLLERLVAGVARHRRDR